MSNNLRKYLTIPKCGGNKEGLLVTAILPEEKYGLSVQFTIGNKFVCLSEPQTWDLIETLLKRVGLLDGYAATQPNINKVIPPIEKYNNIKWWKNASE